MKRFWKLLPCLALSGAIAIGLGACSHRSSSAAQSATPTASTQQPSSESAAAGAQSGTQAGPGASQGQGSQAAKAATAQGAGASPAPGTSTDASKTTAGSLASIATMPAKQSLPDGHWKAGINYDVISPAQPDTAPPGKVQVLEVFWLGCPHCYALEPYLQSWLKKKPSYVQFVRVPVMWGPVHRLHAQLFYTLEALGRDDLVEKAFDTIHNDDNPLVGTTVTDTFQKQLDWAKSVGVSASAFTTAYHSFGVHTSLEHAQEVTDRYHVTGVPMIIIDGKYSTGVGEAGGHPQLIQLIDFLAAAEHERTHRG